MICDSECFALSPNFNDYISYGLWIQINATDGSPPGGTITTDGPLGDNYVTLQNTGGAGSWIQHNVLFGSSTVFFGTRVNSNLNTGGGGLMIIDANSNPLITLVLNGLGGGTVFLGGFGTFFTPNTDIISTIPNFTFPSTGWFYLEMSVTVAPGTSGSVRIRFNNVPLSLTGLTGINTQTGTTTSVGGVGLLSPEGSVTASYTHLYMGDDTGPAPQNDFLGDIRVQGVFATSNVATDFTPNGLSQNWQNISQVPPNSTVDFNADATVGAQDTFNFSAMSPTLGQVYGINAKMIAAKSDAGQRSLELIVQSGTTTISGPPVSLGVSSLGQTLIVQNDPDTGVQWSQSGINAVNLGYKITS